MPLEFTLVTECDSTLEKMGIHSLEYRNDYNKISEDLQWSARVGNWDEYDKVVRGLASDDLFFLMYFVLDMPINHPFLIARINEVQDDHKNTIDLWAREHWKSTILTYALPIQQLIRNPKERICIFSHTRAIAKSHMRRIKFALEQNEQLRRAYPDIFYQNPQREAPKWSEDDGIYVKRRGIFNEASVEAWGLVDGMPTSKHYTVRIYDDIITEKSVNTPEQMRKVYDCYKMSNYLGARGGEQRIIGTRYDNKDAYADIMAKKKWKIRKFPAEVDEEGEYKRGGKPVFKTEKELEELYADSEERIYNAQMGQTPSATSYQQFVMTFLRYWIDKNQLPRTLNKIIIVDPAKTKDYKSDFTVIQVWGLSARREFWLIDMVRDKLALGERWEKVRDFGIEYGVIDLAYETINNTDIEYIRERMEAEAVYFNITEIGGNIPKVVRISALHPLFKNGRIILPKVLSYRDSEKQHHNLVSEFLYDEYTLFPYCTHDDMLDCMARLLDKKLSLIFPTMNQEEQNEKKKGNMAFDEGEPDISWMSQ